MWKFDPYQLICYQIFVSHFPNDKAPQFLNKHNLSVKSAILFLTLKLFLSLVVVLPPPIADSMALRFWRSSVRGPKMTKASANACHTWAQMTNHCSPPVTAIAPPSMALLCPKIQALVQRSGLQVIQRTLASFGTGSRSLLRCCWVRKLEKPRHHFWREMPEKKGHKVSVLFCSSKRQK